MHNAAKKNIVAFSAVAMLIMVLDAKTVLSGAQCALDSCIHTVVPSLFPFIFMSSLIAGNMSGYSPKILRPIGRLCRIPQGTEMVLLLGFIGGYPLGAQMISMAYKSGNLSRNTAHRMLGFCSNAGPAFIFGLIASKFHRNCIPWVIWLVHIVSSVITGILLPRTEASVRVQTSGDQISLTRALHKSITAMAAICGWIILFRVLIAFLQSWCLWLLPTEIGVMSRGLLELTNGCLALDMLPNESIRFLFANIMLSWGGLCVFMQTQHVTGGLGTGMYLRGKLLQSVCAFMLSLLISPILFPGEIRYQQCIIPLIIASLLAAAFQFRIPGKKTVAITM